jgi:hypothetical protein
MRKMPNNWYKGYSYGIANLGKKCVYYVYDQSDHEKVVESGTAASVNGAVKKAKKIIDIFNGDGGSSSGGIIHRFKGFVK